ncbi:MAG: prolipoprotein diacylglyceryl transferase [Clostridiaceae bacterium]|nr:prolipoprotein diacylglyceryl transferase [Clostridiaceae bacterium]
MKNDLLTIGPVTIHGYGLMIAIGFFAAYIAAEKRAKKMGMDPDQLFNLTIYTMVFGLLSAKLLYYITIIKDIIADPSLLLNFTDGFVVYGGIIGGILAGYVFARVKKMDFWKYFDLVVPSIALAQGFGRIGCLLAGCCYGTETTSPIGIVFHESQFAPNGISLVPTQTISSALNFLHFFILITFAKHKKADGQVAALYLIFYSIGRFILEFYRGDLIRGSVGQLSTSQFISIFVCIAGVILFIITGKKNPIAEETKETDSGL